METEGMESHDLKKGWNHMTSKRMESHDLSKDGIT